MVSSISGTSYNKPIINTQSSTRNSTQNKQKTAEPTVEDYQKQKLAGPGMSLERFTEIFESDAPIEEKLAEITDAFGSIIDKDALETSINSAKSGKMSIEEMYRRAYARSWGRALTMEEADTMMKESQRVRRPHVFGGNNDPDIVSKFQPINAKINSGMKLTAGEKSFLRKYYPEVYEEVVQAEQEAERVKKAMEKAKSPEAAQQILMNAQMAALSGNQQGSNFLLAQMLGRMNSNNLGISMFDIQA